ncbi:MAG: beta-ketoacyl-ACP synthase III [Spirochaetaceae bacterium]
MTAEISAVGAYVPERRVSNEDLAQTVDTSDEWIRSHTGIGNRHIASDDEASSDLGVKAARTALERAGVAAEEIDMIICSTASPDYPGFPATASLIEEKLGAQNAGAFDILAGCTGFVYGLELARGLIFSGAYRNVLVVAAEELSKITNWQDRSTCVLFGDGAGAVVVQGNPHGGDRGILNSILRSQGAGAKALIRPAGGTAYPFKPGETPPEDLLIQMDGRAVYNFAVKANTDILRQLVLDAGHTLDDVRYVVPHQANSRIIEAAAKRLGMPFEKFYVNIDEYANTSTASIPIALNEMHEKGMLEKGDLILTVGFGAGLTSGGTLIRW